MYVIAFFLKDILFDIFVVEVVEILTPVYNNIHSNSWNGHQIVPSDDNIDNDDDEDQTWVTKKHFYYIV